MNYQQQPVHTQRVVVTDIEMRFGSMVIFMFKWVLASIPAFLLLSGVGVAVSVAFASCLTAMGIAGGHR